MGCPASACGSRWTEIRGLQGPFRPWMTSALPTARQLPALGHRSVGHGSSMLDRAATAKPPLTRRPVTEHFGVGGTGLAPGVVDSKCARLFGWCRRGRALAPARSRRRRPKAAIYAEKKILTSEVTADQTAPFTADAAYEEGNRAPHNRPNPRMINEASSDH